MWLRIGIFAVLATTVTGCADGSSLEQINERHSHARGGTSAIESIEAIRIKMEIVEPEFSVAGEYVATRDGQMRIDIFADSKRVFTEALDGKGGWQMFGDGTVSDLSLEGYPPLEHGRVSNLYGLHEHVDLGYSLKLIGRVSCQETECWEIEHVSPTGCSQHLFLDTSSYLIVGDVETRALHPDIDATEVPQRTVYSDPRDVEGVIFAFKSEIRNLETGDLMSTATIESIEVNPRIAEKYFDRPSSN